VVRALSARSISRIEWISALPRAHAGCRETPGGGWRRGMSRRRTSRRRAVLEPLRTLEPRARGAWNITRRLEAVLLLSARSRSSREAAGLRAARARHRSLRAVEPPLRGAPGASRSPRAGRVVHRSAPAADAMRTAATRLAVHAAITTGPCCSSPSSASRSASPPGSRTITASTRRLPPSSFS